MRCPVCDAHNLDDSPECTSCGKTFPSHAGSGGAAPALEDLEMTQVASPDGAVRAEPLAGLEHTRFQEDGVAQPQWTGGGIELDSGREPDSGERTAVPTETATCPWCGTASLGAICDACGRRKARCAEPPPEEEQRASGAGTVTCPACFARVAREVRCSDCGMPFPLQEL
jgi:hypothetical protein